jgi:two-component system response regulator AtoC
MRRLLETLEKVARSDAIVRICGENGTGKGYIARHLHRISHRGSGPFVEIACANLPESLFESELFGYEKGSHTDAGETRRGRLEEAAGGTVLFDGLGELAPGLQAKLLRLLQERCFERLGGHRSIPLDARVLVTSAEDLEQAVEQGRFRRDLFYRLDVVRLEVPPLRERGEDIDRLATVLLRHYRKVHRRPMKVLTPEARALLRRHHWPGNVRELRNAVEHAVLTTTGREVGAGDLRLGSPPAAGRLVEEGARRQMTLAELEAAYIRRVLLETRGNYTRAASILGISRKTLLQKRRRYGIPD